ncbi:MAG: hypothetical protein ACE5JI_13710, partial [Acidobacteriota bacterium]
MKTTRSKPSAQFLRRLPSVERLLEQGGFRALAQEFGRREVLSAARAALAELRDAVRDGMDGERFEQALAGVEESVQAKLASVTAPSLTPLINATG